MTLTLNKEEIEEAIKSGISKKFGNILYEDEELEVSNSYELPDELRLDIIKKDVEYINKLELLDTTLKYRKDRINWLNDTISMIKDTEDRK